MGAASSVNEIEGRLESAMSMSETERDQLIKDARAGKGLAPLVTAAAARHQFEVRSRAQRNSADVGRGKRSDACAAKYAIDNGTTKTSARVTFNKEGKQEYLSNQIAARNQRAVLVKVANSAVRPRTSADLVTVAADHSARRKVSTAPC